jgi:hypothetical protein
MSPIRLGKLKDIKILIICTHLAWSSGLDRININEISVLGPQMKTGVWNGQHPVYKVVYYR